MTAVPLRQPGALHATLAGLAASLVGIGLARFAYTPLLTALIDAGWFEESAAVYLGAANLAGYLAGALLARGMASRTSPAFVLRGMMLLACAAFFACALPLSFLWYFLWRFASGLSGGALMALAAPTVMPVIPAARQGLAGGAIFTGVGLGIAASGTLVPFCLGFGLAETWIVLGCLSLVLTLAFWRGWPDETTAGTVPSAAVADMPPDNRLRAIYAEYALNAAGLVPHMVFLVDYIARGLGRGLAEGAFYWVLFGLGALAGPVAAGRLADRIGFAATLRLALLLQAGAVILITMTERTTGLAVSSFIVGAFVPGVVPLVLGRVRELAGPDRDRQRRAWGFATTAFAGGQAAAAWLFSWLFTRSGDYLLLFQLGAGAMILALVIDLVTRQR